MISEEEAKKLYCAFDVSNTCLGSGCMSWKKEIIVDNSMGTNKKIDTGNGYCKRLERVIHG